MEIKALQIEFDRLTKRGIVLGYVWIMGIGSLISLISAYQANKLFSKSGHILEGKVKIKKCIFIGAAGIFVLIIAIAVIYIFRKK